MAGSARVNIDRHRDRPVPCPGTRLGGGSVVVGRSGSHGANIAASPLPMSAPSPALASGGIPGW